MWYYNLLNFVKNFDISHGGTEFVFKPKMVQSKFLSNNPTRTLMSNTPMYSNRLSIFERNYEILAGNRILNHELYLKSTLRIHCECM